MKLVKKILLCILGLFLIIAIISVAIFAGFGDSVLKALSMVGGVYLFVYCKWVISK
jgi:hypothetical protein